MASCHPNKNERSLTSVVNLVILISIYRSFLHEKWCSTIWRWKKKNKNLSHFTHFISCMSWPSLPSISHQQSFITKRHSSTMMPNINIYILFACYLVTPSMLLPAMPFHCTQSMREFDSNASTLSVTVWWPQTNQYICINCMSAPSQWICWAAYSRAPATLLFGWRREWRRCDGNKKRKRNALYFIHTWNVVQSKWI